MFYEDCSFSPLILLFMFIDGLLTVRVGNQQWLPAKMLIKSSCGWWACPLHQPTLTGGSACVEKVLKCRCGLWTDGDAAFPPWCWWIEPEVALDNVCAKFYFCLHLSVFTKWSSFALCTFSVLLNTTIYHYSNNNPRERLSRAAEHRSLWEHCMSSAEAPDLPRNVKLCVYVCAHNTLQRASGDCSS